jgi:hypothetical protein
MPVKRPAQKGELAESASICGSQARAWFIKAIAISRSSMPMWMCSPKINVERRSSRNSPASSA